VLTSRMRHAAKISSDVASVTSIGEAA
jgi:hypothetical protein